MIVTSEVLEGMDSQHLQSTNTTSTATLSIILATVICLLLVTKSLLSKKLKLPPGPRGWPIIGSLLHLKLPIHRTFAELAQKYGPVMHLRLGVWDAVVISGVKEVEELFKTRDVAFALRPHKTILRLSTKYLGFDGQDIVFQKSASRLKYLRKICMTDLLSPTTFSPFSKLRLEEMNRLVTALAAASDKETSLEFRGSVAEWNTNVMTELIFRKRLFGADLPEDPQLVAFRHLVHEIARLSCAMNIADLIPALEWLDPAGMLPQYKNIQVSMNELFDRIVEEHRQTRALKDSKHIKDFCDVLLDHQESADATLNDDEVKGLLLDMLGGGIETSPPFVEWVFAELLCNATVFRKLQEEVDSVVGFSRAVAEADVRNLPYLDAVVKETFRLHPVLPLLIPRSNEVATTLAGYDIPQDTAVFINMWAIGRDPGIWDNPLDFNPNRFLAGANSTVSMNGQSFELLPFGSGRRMCPGFNFANVTVKFILASLVHAFDWKPSQGHKFDRSNLKEENGLTGSIDVPIMVVPIARSNVKHYQ